MSIIFDGRMGKGIFLVLVIMVLSSSVFAVDKCLKIETCADADYTHFKLNNGYLSLYNKHREHGWPGQSSCAGHIGESGIYIDGQKYNYDPTTNTGPISPNNPLKVSIQKAISINPTYDGWESLNPTVPGGGFTIWDNGAGVHWHSFEVCGPESYEVKCIDFDTCMDANIYVAIDNGILKGWTTGGAGSCAFGLPGCGKGAYIGLNGEKYPSVYGIIGNQFSSPCFTKEVPIKEIDSIVVKENSATVLAYHSTPDSSVPVPYVHVGDDGPAGNKYTHFKLCGQPMDNDKDGFMINDGDCDDNDAAIHPGALEICDSVDNDCDGNVDENPNYICGNLYKCVSGECEVQTCQDLGYDQTCTNTNDYSCVNGDVYQCLNVGSEKTPITCNRLDSDCSAEESCRIFQDAAYCLPTALETDGAYLSDYCFTNTCYLSLPDYINAKFQPNSDLVTYTLKDVETESSAYDVSFAYDYKDNVKDWNIIEKEQNPGVRIKEPFGGYILEPNNAYYAYCEKESTVNLEPINTTDIWHLEPGWNFIGLTCNPENPLIEYLFDGYLSGDKIKYINEFEAGEGFKLYMSENPSVSTLFDLTYGNGYQVYISLDSAPFSIQLPDCDTDEPLSIDLKTGYNLITVTEKTTPEELGCDAKYFVDYSKEVVDISTKTQSQQIEFDHVPLNMLYVDNNFYGCEYDGGVDDTENMVDKENYCSVKGSFFCSYGETYNGTIQLRPEWSDIDSGTAKAIERNKTQDISELELKRINFGMDSSKGYREIACCPEDYCWNGYMCVQGVDLPLDQERYESYTKHDIGKEYHSNAFAKEFGYSNKSKEFDMHICTREKIITDDDDPSQYYYTAHWNKSYYKETWDNQSHEGSNIGYCLKDSQCWIGTECVDDGWYTYKTSYPSSADVGDHYCDNGTWTTRTKKIAERMLYLANTRSPDNYTLFCGDAEDVLNYYEYNVDGVLLTYIISGTNANNLCVLKYNFEEDGEYDYAVGISLNQHIDKKVPFPVAIDGFDGCNLLTDDFAQYRAGVREAPDNYEKCRIYTQSLPFTFWYKFKDRSVIFFDKDFTQTVFDPAETSIFDIVLKFFTNPTEAISDILSNFIKPRVDMFNYDKVDVIKNYDNIYFEKHEDKIVHAVKEKITDSSKYLGANEVMRITYYNFTTDLCENIINYYQQEDMLDKIISCQPVVTPGDQMYYQVYSSDPQTFTNWKEITAKLRTNQNFTDAEIPSATILYPEEGTTFYMGESVHLEALEDSDAYRYYWDLESSEAPFNGQYEGLKLDRTLPLDLVGINYITLITLNKKGEYNISQVSTCIDNGEEDSVCNPDRDQDEVCNSFFIPSGATCSLSNNNVDNCPLDANPNQENMDLILEEKKGGVYGIDIKGDACDNDIDGDGVPNEMDCERDVNGICLPGEVNDYRYITNKCGDLDGDGCDDCGGILWNQDSPDWTVEKRKYEINPATDNYIVRNRLKGGSEFEADSDNDGICDPADDDSDNDGVPDEYDSARENPLVCGDWDEDNCDDCRGAYFDYDAYQTAIDNGEEYLIIETEEDDVDKDGKCESGNTDTCVDKDKDGVGIEGFNSGCALPGVVDKDDTSFKVCYDIDNDGCDDCSGLVQKGDSIIVHNFIVNSTANGGSEICNDNDADGYSDRPLHYTNAQDYDKDDDNDGVCDPNEFADYCYSTDDLTNDADPFDKNICGDFDKDGCFDCAGIGLERQDGSVVEKFNIVYNNEIGKYVVKTMEYGGSEVESDTINNGICDSYDSNPPQIETVNPEVISNLEYSLTLYLTEYSTCNYTFDGESYTMLDFGDRLKSSYIDITNYLDLRINNLNLNPADDDELNNIIAISYDLPSYCNYISDQDRSDECNDISYFNKAFRESSSADCASIGTISSFLTQQNCNDYVEEDANYIESNCGTNDECYYMLALKTFSSTPCSSISDGNLRGLCYTSVERKVIDAIDFLATNSGEDFERTFTYGIVCFDGSSNKLEDSVTLDLMPSIDLKPIFES